MSSWFRWAINGMVWDRTGMLMNCSAELWTAHHLCALWRRHWQDKHKDSPSIRWCWTKMLKCRPTCKSLHQDCCIFSFPLFQMHWNDLQFPYCNGCTKLGIWPRLEACCKLFERESFNIWSTKHRLITKLIAELVCKLRDESNELN